MKVTFSGAAHSPHEHRGVRTHGVLLSNVCVDSLCVKNALLVLFRLFKLTLRGVSRMKSPVVGGKTLCGSPLLPAGED